MSHTQGSDEISAVTGFRLGTVRCCATGIRVFSRHWLIRSVPATGLIAPFQAFPRRDPGHQLETLVSLENRRSRKDLYYYANGSAVDLCDAKGPLFVNCDGERRQLGDAPPMKTELSPPGNSPRASAARVSRSAMQSRLVRELTEQGMTQAERLTLALELSDLCEELATAGRRALQERS